MEKMKREVTKKRRFGRIFILLYSLVMIAAILGVFLTSFNPGQNSPGALASTAMDVICIIILIIMVMSIAYETERIGRTTKLFLELMLGTMWALFFDFLTWSLDGTLEYGNWTYVFTIASLCSGAILGGVFCYYLCSYYDDMYELNGLFRRAKACLIINSLAFLITVTMAITKTAFVFVDGHYQLGELYDIITVLPLLTLFYMLGYSIVHIKKIGIHDIVAVMVYILTMIGGVALEAVFGFGASYVSITIADVFIFVMLQNKLINRTKQQKEQLSEQIHSQFAIMESMNRIYSYVYYADLEDLTVRRFDKKDSITETLDYSSNPHSALNCGLYEEVNDEQKDAFWAYTDLSTLTPRMTGLKIISAEFISKKEGWFRAQYIRIGDSVYEPIKQVIYTIRNIDEEKKNMEKWIQKSNTDAVTGFYNRHAYEDEIATLKKIKINDNFVYISMDVNGLKLINDNLGHEAGDELLVGACSCMRRVFGSYGNLYRIGGDEFVALIHASESQMESIINDFNETARNWRGKLIEGLTISLGYVTGREAETEGMSLHQMAVLADKRMYDDKTSYYQKKGIDRRGQKDAHVALCNLYTKILQINITEDKYQIINVIPNEQTAEMGYSEKLSEWFAGFGNSGQVHPYDLAEYLAKTSLDFISSHFRNESGPLRIFYRRMIDGEYKRVMMEMIPANNYKDDVQNLFLYVKNVEP